MKDIKLPGFLWVVLIAVAIVLIETFVPVEFQAYGEIAVVALLGAAKAFNLGTKEIDDLLALLRQLQAQVPRAEAAYVEPEIEKHEPNGFVRWLVG